jgi:transposase
MSSLVLPRPLAGKRPGLTTAEQRRIAELEREVRELRRANEILKAASGWPATGRLIAGKQ